MSFDAYAAWLQIPADRRPPNHYELLGLAAFEPDPERIKAAVMQRTALVRKYQLGQHADEAIRLLGEISRAFDCLTDGARKQAYDRELRGQPTILAEPSATIADVAAPRAAALAPIVAPLPRARPLPPTPLKVESIPSPSPRIAKRRVSQKQQAVFAIAGVAVVFVVGLIWIVSQTESPGVAHVQPVAAKTIRNNVPPVERPSQAPPFEPAPSTTPAAPVAPAVPSPMPEPAPTPTPEASPEPAATPMPTSSTPDPPEPGEKVDLLKLIDVGRDAVRGTWHFDARGHLQSPRNVTGVLELPVDVPEEYILSVQCMRLPYTQPATLVIGLPTPRGPFAFVVDGGGKAGLEMVDGRSFDANETTHAGGVYPNATTTTFKCTVLKSRVTVTSNRKPVVDWQGDLSRLSLNSQWSVRNPRRPFIACHSNHHIWKIGFTPLGDSSSTPMPTMTPPPAASSLAQRAQTLIDEQAVETAGNKPPVSSALSESMLSLIDEALAADDFDVAIRLADALSAKAADAIRDSSSRARLRARISDARKSAADWRGVKIAKGTLQLNPDDPTANHTYGKFICVSRQDWPRGLPLLARSFDTALVSVVKEDLANPTDPQARLEVADHWWELALKTSEEPLKRTCMARAVCWYKLVSDPLYGTAAGSRATKRLIAAESANVTMTPPAGGVSRAAGAGAVGGGVGFGGVAANELVARFRGQLKLTCSSSYSSSWGVDRLIDGRTNTSWFTATNDSVGTGGSPWFAVEFPADVSVQKVRVFGNREGTYAQQPHQVISATVALQDSTGRPLRSTTANRQGPYGDLEFNFGAAVTGVRILRFQSTSDQGALNSSRDIALGELEIE